MVSFGSKYHLRYIIHQMFAKYSLFGVLKLWKRTIIHIVTHLTWLSTLSKAQTDRSQCRQYNACHDNYCHTTKDKYCWICVYSWKNNNYIDLKMVCYWDIIAQYVYLICPLLVWMHWQKKELKLFRSQALMICFIVIILSSILNSSTCAVCTLWSGIKCFSRAIFVHLLKLLLETNINKTIFSVQQSLSGQSSCVITLLPLSGSSYLSSVMADKSNDLQLVGLYIRTSSKENEWSVIKKLRNYLRMLIL